MGELCSFKDSLRPVWKKLVQKYRVFTGMPEKGVTIKSTITNRPLKFKYQTTVYLNQAIKN
jgi:hypothetical protein